MIRPAGTADIPALLAIWNPVIRDTPFTFNDVEKIHADLARTLTDKAASGHAFLVAVNETRLHGFATCGQFRTGTGYAHSMEHTVIIAPQSRGHGIGRSLMGALETQARAAGAHSFYGGVSAENPVAFAFHLALGFTEIATLPQVGRKFGRWIDLHLMQKFLTGPHPG